MNVAAANYNATVIRLTLFVVFLAPLWAQNSITVTASRTSNAQADLAVFAIDVLTDLNTSRDEVVALGQGSILTAANFSTVRTVQIYQPDNGQKDYLDWTFSVTAPLVNFKALAAQLTSLQQQVAQKQNGMSLSFSMQGTAVSAQALQALSCSMTNLMADARTQATKIAAAAGAGLGNVLAMASSTASGSVPAYSPTCALTVKFALTGL